MSGLPAYLCASKTFRIIHDKETKTTITLSPIYVFLCFSEKRKLSLRFKDTVKLRLMALKTSLSLDTINHKRQEILQYCNVFEMMEGKQQNYRFDSKQNPSISGNKNPDRLKCPHSTITSTAVSFGVGSPESRGWTHLCQHECWPAGPRLTSLPLFQAVSVRQCVQARPLWA